MIIIYNRPEERVVPEHIGWGSDYISQMKQTGSEVDSIEKKATIHTGSITYTKVCGSTWFWAKVSPWQINHKVKFCAGRGMMQNNLL